jgi:hypothetical protein
MGRSLGRWVLSRAAILATVVLVIATVSPPLYGQESALNAKALAHRLAAIEEENPFRLQDLVRNGRPTLIAFIDHLCFTCLRSVGTVEELKSRFSDQANIAVIDPSRISVAHGWAKDRYRVWFVPKFVILDKHGDVAKEYFGPTPIQTLTSDLQSLQAQ